LSHLLSRNHIQYTQNLPCTVAFRYQSYSPYSVSVATSYSGSIQIPTM